MKHLHELEDTLALSRATYSLRPLADSLYTLIDNLPDSIAEIRLHKALWHIRMNYGRTPAASIHAEIARAERSASDVSDGRSAALTHLLKGMAEYKSGAYLSAYKHLRRALSLFEEEGDTLNAAYADSYLGMTFERLGEYDSATKYFLSAITTFLHHDADFAAAQLSINLANAIARTDPERADSILRHTIATATEAGDTSLALNARISLWSRKEAAHPQAADKAAEILDMALAHGDIEDTALASINLAEALVSRHPGPKALKAARQAVAYAEASRNQWIIFNALPPLTACLEAAGRTDSAFHYQKLYLALSDSLSLNPGIRTNSPFTLETKEALADYDERLAAERHGTLLRNIIIAVSAISIIIIVIAAIITFRNIRHRHLAEQQMQLLRQKQLQDRNEILKLESDNKSRQLSARAVSLDTKNAILKDILAHKDSYSVDDIITRLKRHINEEENRENYQEVFEKTNPEFFLRLKAKAPSLSENELRHCCLIAMGLSIKQIATLLGITPDSVQKARYRLRKKLLNDSDLSLEEMIRSMYSPAQTSDAE